MGVLPACVSVPHEHAVPTEATGGYWIPLTGVIGSCAMWAQGSVPGRQDHPVLLPLEPPHVVNIFLCVMCMPGVHLRERRERSEEEGKEEERVGGLELSFHHVGS